MPMHNQTFSEGIGILAVVNPQSATAGTYTSGWVDLDIWGTVAGVLFVGTISSTGTVAAKLQQATDSGGTGVKDVTSKAIVGLTQTPTDNSNSQQFINCRADELDIQNNFRFVRLSVTTATAASLLTGAIMGVNCKYAPASDHDATTVTQYVN